VHTDPTLPPAAVPRTKIDTVPAWRGSDATAVVTLLLSLIPIGGASVATIALELPKAAQIAAWAAFALVLALAFAAMFRKIPARVALAENAIVVHGLVFRRSVDLPCEIEMGTIRDSRPSAIHSSIEYNSPSVEFDAGTYLRFAGSREIVVACRAKASSLGMPRGPKRKQWDVELPREAFVALQYGLIDRGLLTVA
jgi:hypothetical protein